MLGSRSPSPSSSSGEGLNDSQKLQLVVRNCVQKTVELVLHSRLLPLPASMRRGQTNRWVRAAVLDEPIPHAFPPLPSLRARSRRGQAFSCDPHPTRPFRAAVQPRVGGAADGARRARGLAAGHGTATAARHLPRDRRQLADPRCGRRDRRRAEHGAARALAPAVRVGVDTAVADLVAGLLQAAHGASAVDPHLPATHALAPARPLARQARHRRAEPAVPAVGALVSPATEQHGARLSVRARHALLFVHAARRSARQAVDISALPTGRRLWSARATAAKRLLRPHDRPPHPGLRARPAVAPVAPAAVAGAGAALGSAATAGVPVSVARALRRRRGRGAV